MKRLLMTLFLILAIPILLPFSKSAPVPFESAAMACETTTSGNYCVEAERKPTQPGTPGSLNREVGRSPVGLGADAGFLAFIILMLALRR
jgi:hypothetical protein